MRHIHSEYLDWAFHQKIPRFHLARSGVSDCSKEDLSLTLDDIILSGRNVDGCDELKDLIAAEYKGDASQVVPVHGTTTGNFVTFGALVGVGDEVIIEQPTYDPLIATAKFLGANIKRVERSFANGFEIDLATLKGQLSPKTKLVVLSNPHNPSGVLLSERVILEIAKLAASVGAYLLVDEVYRDIWFEDAPKSHFLNADNVIATNSLTKSYGLGGVRAGWILCKENLAVEFQRFYNLVSGTNAIPVDGITVAALKNIKRLRERTRSIIVPNYNLIEEFVNENSQFIDVVLPKRSIIIFPKLKRGSVDNLYQRLLALGASVVPGRFFESPEFFRLGFAQEKTELCGGLELLSIALKEVS